MPAKRAISDAEDMRRLLFGDKDLLKRQARWGTNGNVSAAEERALDGRVRIDIPAAGLDV